MFAIGDHCIRSRAVLAPMAGVTDRPFRALCRRFGAGYAVAEMVTANTALWQSRKSRTRLPARDELEPRVVQIAGGDPELLAAAAKAAVARGAQIVDINMGCPAKKVCRRQAGSALLSDERLVARILRAVVAAVAVPVTLKMRTGPDPQHRNGPTIARIAEDCGVALLAVHGRTRACRFAGRAEYDTIAEIVARVRIPVLANGDIDSPAQAARVLAHTGAAGVMIGRGACGNPWIFRALAAYLDTGRAPPPPSREEWLAVVREHLAAIHHHYGEPLGVGMARKHVGFYLERLPGGTAARRAFNALPNARAQAEFLQRLPTSLWPCHRREAA
ncbi:MAG: tRNA-dihydrouridine synthase B [Porticoccaceae bacterium]|nr:MAG: tRNA-dihydrouridine synthase B [Porticoccaceae bacterium]